MRCAECEYCVVEQLVLDMSSSYIGCVSFVVQFGRTVAYRPLGRGSTSSEARAVLHHSFNIIAFGARLAHCAVAYNTCGTIGVR